MLFGGSESVKMLLVIVIAAPGLVFLSAAVV